MQTFCNNNDNNRELTLDDILNAIKSLNKKDNKKYFSENVYIEDKYIKSAKDFSITKSFSNQSEEWIDFIYNLIK